MEIFKDTFTRRFSISKGSFDYKLYKYEDIPKKSIVHEGYLQYLYNTNIFGDSSFRLYHVVLSRISTEHCEDTIGMYLFLDDKKVSSYFFVMDQSTKFSDHSIKGIKPIPKYFLIELTFNDKDEIFGAKDDLERKSWMEVFKNLFSKSNTSIIESRLSYLIPVNPINPVPDHVFYPEFSFNDRHHQINNQIINKNKERSSIGSESEASPYSIVEPTDYSRSSTHSRSSNECQSKIDSSSSQRLVWNQIFYLNQNDDYKSILIKTGDKGAFLIRPHSKKTSSSDHDYTLCVYTGSTNVRCFAIYQLTTRKNEYSLSTKSDKSFVDMIDLCEYYRTNPLPSSINNINLKKPYKYYEHNYTYIE